MTIINRWLLPEGVEEILPPKAIQLEHLCRTVIDLLSTWGYEFVIPPMIEYLESLLTGTGEDLDLKTFKLTDQLSGRLMGIRADMTPQVARIDAHLLKRDTPTRLCYLGSVLHSRPGKSGETRSPLQLGAELFGHSGVASDIEIVRLMLTTLKHVGINKSYIDIGHIGIFRSLSAKSSLKDDQQTAVFEALQRKAKDELKSLYKRWSVKDKASKALLNLIDLNGDVSVLTEAKKIFKNISPEVLKYIGEIKVLADSIKDQSGVSINIDLAELRGYHYHTGMIYTAFVPGKGEGIAFGGRYDDIGSAFGRARPATGFSMDVKSLLKFQNTKDNIVAKRIFAPATDDLPLQKRINQLRKSGKIVIQELKGQKAKANKMNCDQQLVLEKGKWVIKKIN